MKTEARLVFSSQNKNGQHACRAYPCIAYLITQGIFIILMPNYKFTFSFFWQLTHLSKECLITNASPLWINFNLKGAKVLWLQYFFKKYLTPIKGNCMFIPFLSCICQHINLPIYYESCLVVLRYHIASSFSLNSWWDRPRMSILGSKGVQGTFFSFSFFLLKIEEKPRTRV